MTTTDAATVSMSMFPRPTRNVTLTDLACCTLLLYMLAMVFAGVVTTLTTGVDTITTQTVGVSLGGAGTSVTDITQGGFLITRSFYGDLSVPASPGTYRLRTPTPASYVCVLMDRLFMNNAEVVCADATAEGDCTMQPNMVVTEASPYIQLTTTSVGVHPRVCTSLDAYGAKLYFERVT